MATIHPTVRKRTFRQAHQVAPPDVFRQAHPRTRPQSSPARVGLAVALALLAAGWSLPHLPVASAAEPARTTLPRPQVDDVASRSGNSGAALRDQGTVTVAGARLSAADETAVGALPVAGAGSTDSIPTPSTPFERGPASPAPATDSPGPATASDSPHTSTEPPATRHAAATRPSVRVPTAPIRAVARAGGLATRSNGSVSARAGLSSMRAVAAFLGDSYTTGWVGAGLGAAGWPAIVSAALGLRATNDAVAGTGFVNPGWTGQPMATRLTDVVRARPRIVFVAGGHNDRRFSTGASAAAADLLLNRLRAALPTSVIVVVAPIWQDGRPPASLRTLRDHLRAASARIGALFIDPLADPWFGGAAHRLIGPDGIHPTNAGHRRIADLVLRALEADSGMLAALRAS